MFEQSIEIRYSDVDLNGYVSPDRIAMYFQDCVTGHSDSLGLTVSWHAERNCAWFLTFLQLDCYRFPVHGQRVRIQTQPYRFQGAIGLRSTRMVSEDGEVLAVSNMQWVHMDTKNLRILPPTQEQMDLYQTGEGVPFPMEVLPTSLRIPKTGGEAMPSFSVYRSMIDTNGHMNNCQYLKAALDHLPETFWAEGVQRKAQLLGVSEKDLFRPEPIPMRACLSFKKAAQLGDVITPVVYPSGMTKAEEAVSSQTAPFVVLQAADGKPHAMVQVSYL